MFVLAGILTGMMPQVQIHSFVAIAQYSIALCLLTFRPQHLWKWAVYGLIANALALPQVVPFFQRVSTSRRDFLQINPIWRGRKTGLTAPIILWWRGLGVFAAIALVFGWLVATPSQRTLYLPGLFVFAIANVIRYQPWELDNTKLLYAGWIPVALPFVSQYLTKLITNRRSPLRVLLFVVFVVAACLSAFMSTVQSFFWPTSIFDKEDYRFGLWFAENTPSNAVVIVRRASPASPVSCVAGRQLYVGFDGWVSSHGLDMRRIGEQERMLAAPNNVQAFVDRKVSYVVTSDQEEANKFAKAAIGTGKWRLAYMDGRYSAFRLDG
jgi:hypothetical protein